MNSSKGANSQHAYLAKINERHLLRVIRDQGPRSRADLVRATGLSAPTVSKAAASLLNARLLEEIKTNGATLALGRPAPKLRLATESVQVLGIVFDVERCSVVATGLDGELHEERTQRVRTVLDYDDLIDSLVKHARTLMARPGVRTLGAGVTVPGLIDHRRGLNILSPNVHVIDGRSPGRDLADQLGIECRVIQDQHALCMAERYFGRARSLDDFAILDVSSGVGMGVMSGGQLVRGHSGFAGEIGHITVDPSGLRCGCGNRGCLETVASDVALARQVSRRLGRHVDIDEVIRLARAGKLKLDKDCKEVVAYLAIGLAAVINIFNPSTLFIHGQLFDADEGLFARVLEETSKRSLAPSFADCQIIRARGSKRQGAVAGVIQYLMDSVVPELRA
jgi:predicted NBD/HSP70 family sugar kinase